MELQPMNKTWTDLSSGHQGGGEFHHPTDGGPGIALGAGRVRIMRMASPGRLVSQFLIKLGHFVTCKKL